MTERRSTIVRTSERAEIRIALHLDGTGDSRIQSGLPFLDRMLALLARHSGFNLELQCNAAGAESHHLAEEVGICFGMALDKALGDRKGIACSGHSYALADDRLARAVVECAGQSCMIYRQSAGAAGADGMVPEMFWRALSSQACLGMHLELLYGDAGSPAWEAVFRAAGRALRDACRLVR